MDRHKKWFILSIVFLVIALVFPVFAFYNALGTTIRTVSNYRPDYNADNPQTIDTNSFIQAQTAAQIQLLWIVIAVESVMVAAFALTLMYAIRCRDQCRNFPVPTR